MPKLLEAKRRQEVTRKIPQFHQIRKTLTKKNTPEINLKIAYKCKETNEVTVVEDTVTPKSRFPSQEYDKMYEIATVKVNIIKVLYQSLLTKFCFISFHYV